MNSNKLRIFVTTSHSSTIYMTMLALHTRQPGDTDILIIDTGFRREGLIRLMFEAAELHNWDLRHNFSDPVNTEYDFRPTPFKTFIRKIKGWPVIRNVYGVLLKNHMRKRDASYRAKLEQLIPASLREKKAELYLMTETYINRPLQLLFPEADVFYMEHGMGDYYHVLNRHIIPGKMYCVFGPSYRRYLTSQGVNSDWVLDLPGKETFRTLAAELMTRHAATLKRESLPEPAKPIVFILLESVHMYNVPERYWTEYVDHILKQLDKPSDYHYLLKPHPFHSKSHLQITVDHFRKLNLSFDLLGSDELSSISAEVLFSHYAGRVRHAFCIFSSSVYYLSEFYSDGSVTFWQAIDFLSGYIDNAPPQFRKLYTEIKPLVKGVFIDNCKSF